MAFTRRSVTLGCAASSRSFASRSLATCGSLAEIKRATVSWERFGNRKIKNAADAFLYAHAHHYPPPPPSRKTHSLTSSVPSSRPMRFLACC